MCQTVSHVVYPKNHVIRDAPLDSQGGGRKFGSGQVFFSPPKAATVFFSSPKSAKFFFSPPKAGKLFFSLIFMHYTL